MKIQVPERIDYRGYRVRQHSDDLLPPSQLGLPFYGKTVSVDGIFDEKQQIQYMGNAAHVFDNTYWCLAIVGGALCALEVTLHINHPIAQPATMKKETT